MGGSSSAGIAGLAGTSLGGLSNAGGAEGSTAAGEPGVAGEPNSGAGTGGVTVGGTGGEGTCASHRDCGAGTVCSASRCVTCPEAPSACSGACEHGFEPALTEHNGCVVCECTPPSECTSTADCPADEECYPGAQCDPGCTEPRCCSGNHCSAAGCAGSAIPHCLIAGCAGGAVCLAACSAVTCECEGATWKCAESPDTAGALGGSCPQACVSP